MLCLLNAFIPYFFFNDTATTEIYTLSLHDALPISVPLRQQAFFHAGMALWVAGLLSPIDGLGEEGLTMHMVQHLLIADIRSEEHTSELQSRQYLVCRLLLEKKKKTPLTDTHHHKPI